MLNDWTYKLPHKLPNTQDLKPQEIRKYQGKFQTPNSIELSLSAQQPVNDCPQKQIPASHSPQTPSDPIRLTNPAIPVPLTQL